MFGFSISNRRNCAKLSSFFNEDLIINATISCYNRRFAIHNLPDCDCPV